MLDGVLHLRQWWRKLLQAGSLVLLLAFLPSVLYVGHWGELVDYAMGRQGVERLPLDHVAHEAHCHHSASSCSEQPLPVGVVLFPSVVEMPRVELTSFRLESDTPIYGEIFIPPPTEPPRL